MIPQTLHLQPADHWQSELQNGFSDLSALMTHLNIHSADWQTIYQATKFPVKVPRYFADLMTPQALNDPLLRQVANPIATSATGLNNGFVASPLKEESFSPLPGVLHKFKNRILLVLTGHCAVHCQYCFRQNFPYTEHVGGRPMRQKLAAYLNAHPEIEEVVLSGGDPLSLKDTLLADWFEWFNQFSQLKFIRIHTRLPIVLPNRLTNGLLRAIASSNAQVVMVVHSNHPKEITELTAKRFKPFHSVLAALYNQSVLLKGVNDSAETLKALSEALFKVGIQPYYLHELDPVLGSEAYAITQASTDAIYSELMASTSGFLVPRLVREVPGQPNKVLFGSQPSNASQC